jgi:hypothetical protein
MQSPAAAVHGTEGGLLGVDFLQRRGVGAVEDRAAEGIVHRNELGDREATTVLRTVQPPRRRCETTPKIALDSW